jgi:hypothetical protein
MYRLAAVLFALLLLPAEAIGQVAWLGSEELHRGLGGALESMLDNIVQFLIAVLVLAYALIHGTTRLIQRGFKSSGRGPMPLASTSIAFALFSVSFWAYWAVIDAPEFGWLITGLALGLLPAILVLVIEVARVWRGRGRDVVLVGEIEDAVAGD